MSPRIPSNSAIRCSARSGLACEREGSSTQSWLEPLRRWIGAQPASAAAKHSAHAEHTSLNAGRRRAPNCALGRGAVRPPPRFAGRPGRKTGWPPPRRSCAGMGVHAIAVADDTASALAHETATSGALIASLFGCDSIHPPVSGIGTEQTITLARSPAPARVVLSAPARICWKVTTPSPSPSCKPAWSKVPPLPRKLILHSGRGAPTTKHTTQRCADLGVNCHQPQPPMSQYRVLAQTHLAHPGQ